VVHLRGHGARPAPHGGKARVHVDECGSRPHARRFKAFSAALPLGLRRDADSQAHARAPQAERADRPALPPHQLVLVVRRRPPSRLCGRDLAFTISAMPRRRSSLPLDLYRPGALVAKTVFSGALSRRVDCSWVDVAGASLASMALSHAIARAVFEGLWRKTGEFKRTAKGVGRAPRWRGSRRRERCSSRLGWQPRWRGDSAPTIARRCQAACSPRGALCRVGRSSVDRRAQLRCQRQFSRPRAPAWPACRGRAAAAAVRIRRPRRAGRRAPRSRDRRGRSR
jgi:hypothetical protein